MVQDLLERFNSIMVRSSRHLAESDKFNTTDLTHASANDFKEKWWTERRLLDKELENFLADVDDRLFNHSCVQKIVSSYCSHGYVKNELGNVTGNLSLKFEAMCVANALDLSGDPRDNVEGG